MGECECDPPIRQWLGGDSNICLVKYIPDENIPSLLVQCWPAENHVTNDVKKFIKDLISMTGATQIYEDCARTINVDMNMFN